MKYDLRNMHDMISTVSCSLKCYICATPKDSICGDAFNPSKVPSQTCTESEKYCLKAEKTAESGVTEVGRACGNPEYCQAFKKCDYCSVDYCNSAQAIKPQFLFGFLVSIAFVKILI
ncbi:hypothetical protein FQA39_LY17622 [Lamprigera yunnana]|nr:hypothetical protein FQA39_LY17622 [Lamprigera yunnana]